MDKKKFIILAAAAVLLFAAAIFAYNNLSAGFDESENSSSESSSSQQESASEEGEEEKLIAPEFTVYTAEGEPVSLSDFAGKPVIINFWATWCGFCKQEMPDFDKVFKEYGDKVEFMMINVTDGDSETVEKAKGYIEEEDYSFPVYYDTELSATMAYGAYSLPATGLITPSGIFAGGQMGAMSEEDLIAAIEYLLSLE